MAADDDFFNGQEIDEFLEELRRRGMLEIPVKKSRDGSRGRRTPSQVHYQSGVGNFMFPLENSWAAHRQVINDHSLGLYYWPSQHPYFDNMVHQRVNYEPLWNDGNSAFGAYDVLRENLAIVRNYIMCEFFPDGSVDNTKADAQKATHLAQIGQFISDGLNNDRLIPNPMSPIIRADRANLPATGAQYIYSQIIKRQNYQSWLDPILHPIQWLIGKTAGAWDLPALEHSAFSDAALRLPPPDISAELSDDDVAIIADALTRNSMEAPSSSLNFSEELNDAAQDITMASARYAAVDHLQEPTKRESVEIAKEILNKLKLKLGEALIENGLNAFAKANFSIMDALRGAVQVYEFHLHKLMQTDPKIMENPAIIAANAAIGKLGHIAKQDVLKAAEKAGDKELAATVRKEISKMPAHWQQPSEKTFGELLGQVEGGLNTVLLRLTQTAQRNSASQYWMGFSNELAQGRPDPSKGRDDQSQKAMADNAYYQQLNAQRAMRQQQAVAMNNLAAQQRTNRDEPERAGPNAAARRPATTQGVMTRTPPASAPREAPRPAPATPPKQQMGQLVGKDQMASLRQMMATDANAEAVETNRRQQVLRQEMERRQARQQQRTTEQTNRQATQQQAADQNAQRAAQAARSAEKNAAKNAQAARREASATAKAAPPPTPPVKPDTTQQQTTIKAPTHNPNKRDPSRGI